MRKSKINLPAFTLQETIVVLILTALLVSLVYYALRFLQGDVKRLQTTSSYQSEIALFAKQLQRDLDKEAAISISRSNLLLLNESDSIVYSANDTTIIREMNSRKSVQKGRTTFGETKDLSIVTFDLSLVFFSNQNEKTLCVGSAITNFLESDTILMCKAKSTYSMQLDEKETIKALVRWP